MEQGGTLARTRTIKGLSSRPSTCPNTLFHHFPALFATASLHDMSVPAQNKSLFLESKHGQFAVRSTETPKPAPDEILVKIEATALNPLDWKIQSWGIFVEKYPTVLGFDAAGTIVQVGGDVPTSSFTVGDRV